ncbi:MAG: hypothetical protein HYS32_00425 [Candidatus Woesearchaeota archaeon]|nr:MAG: hypothetical protein HYS32_00425 [Candidatus Woesearchaeota archaeon]
MVKKGYIKTLEAVIAIVVVLIFIFSFAGGNFGVKQKKPSLVEGVQDFVFKNVLNNETLRQDVFNGDDTRINKLLEENLPPNYGYKVQFCSVESCPAPALPDKSVFVDSVYVTSSAKSKVLKVFIWED